MVENQTNMNKKYQNKTSKPSHPIEKILKVLLVLKSPKSKNFKTPYLELVFLTDLGAESTTFNTDTWNEIRSLHPKLPVSKT